MKRHTKLLLIILLSLVLWWLISLLGISLVRGAQAVTAWDFISSRDEMQMAYINGVVDGVRLQKNCPDDLPSLSTGEFKNLLSESLSKFPGLWALEMPDMMSTCITGKSHRQPTVQID